MMKSIILAGFGGQGLLFAGRQLASAGMYLGKNVTWLPSYGAESRGGTSNCTVIISDEEVGSPIVVNPDILFVMSLPAYRRFAPDVAPGGIIIADGTMINESCGRDDISEYFIPATKLADDNNMRKSVNVIMLGKLLKITEIFTRDDLIESMRKSNIKESLLDLNMRALDIGFAHE